MEQLQPGLPSLNRRSASAPRCRWWPFVLLLMGAAGMLAGCGGSGGSASATHSSTTNHSSSIPSASSNGSAAAVLKGYRAAWGAFERALADADPYDPGLSSTMVDPQLQGVKANLVSDQQQGIIGRGPTTLHPKVTSISGQTATVVDCTYSSNELVYKATGKPVPPTTPPENDGVIATLVQSGGVWKVSRQAVTDGKCASGS